MKKKKGFFIKPDTSTKLVLGWIQPASEQALRGMTERAK